MKYKVCCITLPEVVFTGMFSVPENGIMQQTRSIGSSTNSELGWAKDTKGFTVSIIPNTTRMTIYYASKPILKMLKNPKRLKFVITDMLRSEGQINKSHEFVEEPRSCTNITNM